MSIKIVNKIPRYILPYPVIYFFVNFINGLTIPIIAIYYRYVGLNLFQIGLVSTIFELSIFIFEIPTGFIADKIGRRFSILLSFLSFSVSGILYFSIRNIIGIICASIMQGIGYTFISGSLQAWAIDTLKQNGDDSYIKSTIVSGTQSRRLGSLLGSVMGGYLGIKNINILWFLYIFLGFAAMVYSYIFVREKREKFLDNGEKFNIKNLLHIDEISKVFIEKDKVIFITAILLFIISIIYEFSLSPVDEYWTILFSEKLKISTFIIGLITAISNIVLIVSVTPIVNYLSKRLKDITAFLAVTILIIFSLVLLASVKMVLISILVFILFRLFTGVYEPIMDYYLNRLLNDQYRATMLSVYSMAGSIGEILSGISIGAIAENRGISIAFYAGAVSLLFELILFFAINKIRKYEYSG
ncbi:hypothetical protein BFT35_08490 [Thermoanaerobacterium thermosaccharolyticum]|uniref:Uncharacterized protein n=1 Tax=Thermoanaerobacterium thermosaccharolyticum TaxID=1517 RepID=A0A231VHL9_THETR|nr:MFS transporter [Thermoanaerobacterium thermosaccharolyticum]OXT07684.1 hypothetical protein CE561_07600 [Thermoanaerobacterium thermosaccharolyticum]PHO06910.1 hypothetical protein BFT35_08490 [Thermoanaerobacterium thermosaccharolyticum]